jgi:hypothetical protein
MPVICGNFPSFLSSTFHTFFLGDWHGRHELLDLKRTGPCALLQIFETVLDVTSKISAIEIRQCSKSGASGTVGGSRHDGMRRISVAGAM